MSEAWTRLWSATDRPTAADSLRSLSARHGKWAAWLVAAIYTGCLAAFVTDLFSPTTAAFGVFYMPLVATAVFFRDRRTVWWLAALGCALNIVGAFFPYLVHNVILLVENRVLSCAAIVATAVFVARARTIQAQLEAQTARAESAERMKSDVLTNLSQEIRAPLYSMIGVLELVAAEGRPEQRAALGMVRTAGRRLLTTVDNLVDLTQLDNNAFPPATIDLGMLLRQTAEGCRADASARQIALHLDVPGGGNAIVNANPWAVRRILENLIADAISWSAPGGHIDIATSVVAGRVSATIADTGTRPPDLPREIADPDIQRLMPSAMGLALGQRLASAIGARLTFGSPSGEGTIARLTLPAAAGEVP